VLDDIIRGFRRYLTRGPVFVTRKALSAASKWQERTTLRFGLRDRDKYVDTLAEFYEPFIHRDDLCFDVGAHRGTRTRAFLALGAKVVAVEPYSANADKLRTSLRRFIDSTQLVVIQKAVSDSEGTAELRVAPGISDVCTITDHFFRAWGERGERIYRDMETVETTTLKSIIDRYGVPDHLKVDTEGAEFLVLSTLAHPIRHVSVEYNQRFLPTAIQCIEKLCELGDYRFNYTIKDQISFELSRLVGAQAIVSILKNLSPKGKLWGDFHAIRVGAG
jgi:FkbM family methyltransferase